MGENLEGQLVRVNAVTFPLSGTVIAGNSSYDFSSSGETGVLYVRTSNTLVGEQLSGCEVDLLGIVSQYTFDGTGGYQLLPRGPVDLVPVSAVCFTTPVSQTNLETTSFTLSWGTDISCDGVIEYGMTEELGLTTSALQNNTTNHFVNLEGSHQDPSIMHVQFAPLRTVLGQHQTFDPTLLSPKVREICTYTSMAQSTIVSPPMNWPFHSAPT